MKIGYAKLGRNIALAPGDWGVAGGDNEPPILLNKLARRNPQHQFVIVGRNSGTNPQSVGFPSNVSDGWDDARRAEIKRIAPAVRSLAQDDRLVQSSYMMRAATIDMFMDLDAIIVWAGQHSPTNFPIPFIGQKEDRLTRPHASFVNYAGWLMQGINAWRDVDPIARRETWLCADNRNYLHARDIKWPTDPFLAQYDFTKTEKQYRFGDERDPQEFAAARAALPDHFDPKSKWSESGVWISNHKYLASGLEIVGIPSTLQCSYNWEGRNRFGILINEARTYVHPNRLEVMLDWVMPIGPNWIHGAWSDESQSKLGARILPLDWNLIWDKVRTVRSTFTTPSSGSGWATTKPWESFGVGTVCFFHPKYDDQGHVIPTLKQAKDLPDGELKELTKWLRVENPEQLRKRVEAVNSDQAAWLWLVQAQRRHFDKMMEDNACIHTIEKRIIS